MWALTYSGPIAIAGRHRKYVGWVRVCFDPLKHHIIMPPPLSGGIKR